MSWQWTPYRIVDLNPMAEILLSQPNPLGRSIEQIWPDRPVMLADFYSPESRFQLIEGHGYRDALAGQFVIQERQLVAWDGRVIETILQTLPEVDAEGRAYGTRAMFVDITECKATEVVREVLSDLETLLEKNDGQVAVGELPTLEADPIQMRQLLQNLLSNVLKFYAKNTPPVVTIDIEAVSIESEAIAEDAR